MLLKAAVAQTLSCPTSFRNSEVWWECWTTLLIGTWLGPTTLKLLILCVSLIALQFFKMSHSFTSHFSAPKGKMWSCYPDSRPCPEICVPSQKTVLFSSQVLNTWYERESKGLCLLVFSLIRLKVTKPWKQTMIELKSLMPKIQIHLIMMEINENSFKICFLYFF